jgi:hypothetical protein
MRSRSRCRYSVPDWDSFDPAAYHAANYAQLRDDDAQILKLLADWFAAADISDHAHGVDVGSGANLYPALVMLPHCRRITMVERGAANRAWLQRQVGNLPESWQPFWDTLADAQPDVYKRLHSPKTALAGRVDVTPGNIYDLPTGRWDAGTMFFVAESITPILSQFQVAVHSFVRSLRPCAPFAAGFVTGSTGYQVGTTTFPAVPVTANNIAAALRPVARDVELHPIVSPTPLRPGVGMIVATGRAHPR